VAHADPEADGVGRALLPNQAPGRLQIRGRLEIELLVITAAVQALRGERGDSHVESCCRLF
jgi:hypothetical protein